MAIQWVDDSYRVTPDYTHGATNTNHQGFYSTLKLRIKHH